MISRRGCPRRSRAARRLGALLGALVSLCSLERGREGASAYTIKSLMTPGCHEPITAEALRRVRRELSTALPLATTANERALVDDLQFTLAADMRDLGGATLIASVRDNDLKGQSATDLSFLSEVHGDPETQDEHCLRSREQNEPDGSVAAVSSCRAFIRERMVEALTGLDTAGHPDLGQRTPLELELALRGRVNAPLPTYYVQLGHGLHALQDSFTHTYRSADGMRITVVLNWVDAAREDLVEARDGPPHVAALDLCNDPDDLRRRRRELATEASVALLRATLAPSSSAEQKLAAVDRTLDRYLSYAPGCTFDNDWCDAPERRYTDAAGCGLRVGAEPGAASALLLAAFLVWLRLARRGRGGSRRPAALALLLSCALAAAGGLALPLDSARANTPPARPTPPNEHAPPPPVTKVVPQPGPRDPSAAAWGAYLGLSGSVSKSAIAFQLGLRRRVSTRWTFGVDGEWNPWLSFNGPSPLRAGVFNLYGTAILRMPLAYEAFNLRTALSVGASYLLIDLFGAPRGSVGPYLGVSPLGLEWKVSRLFLLIINPLQFALPVPKVTGVPLWFPQYRFSVGIGILAD